jgi:hypothetical protein
MVAYRIVREESNDRNICKRGRKLLRGTDTNIDADKGIYTKCIYEIMELLLSIMNG